MRTKVYGKKGRTRSGARAQYNATLSPEKTQGATSNTILAEKSCNARQKTGKLASKTDSDLHQDQPKSADAGSSPPRTPKRGSVESKTPASSSPLGAQPRAAANEELAATFAQLRIQQPSLPPSDSTATESCVPILSPVRTQPVALDAATQAYLEPLLRLKHLPSAVEPFAPWLAARCAGLSLAKVGEGSFGEVYRATDPAAAAAAAAGGAPATAILKLVPLNAPRGPNSRCFTAVAAAAAEVRLLQRMQRVPGFVAFRGACVLRGAMPERLADLWEAFRRTGARSVASRDPRGGRAYPATQLWLLIEMADAGRSLESGEYEPLRQMGAGGGNCGERRFAIRRTWDIWWQVVAAVAKAEVYAEFEHRDLHLGNICAKDRPDCHDEDEEDLELVDENVTPYFPLHRTGVDVTIIDYSLSRATFKPRKNEADEVLFYDFKADKALLNGEGDRQYDMYRYMAHAVGRRHCRDFVPETNVIWLFFILESLLKVTVRPTPQAQRGPGGLPTKATAMMEALEEMRSRLDPAHLDTWDMHSASAILDMAFSRGYFKPEDVIEQ